MTASDPDFANMHQHYLRAAGILCSRPRDTYRLRSQSANTCHCNCQIVLCSTTSDLECAALSSTTRLADNNPCFGCQQGRLLLFHAGWCLQSSTGQAAVHPQCCCLAADFFPCVNKLIIDNWQQIWNNCVGQKLQAWGSGIRGLVRGLTANPPK